MRILGIDPGFDRLGIAIIDKNEKGKESLVYSECFETNKKDSFSERLFLIGKQVAFCIEKYKPEYLSIEKLYMTVNQKTAMNVAEARGVVIYESQKSNITKYEITNMKIKMAITDFGKATKNDVAKMVPKLIVLESKKMKDDEIDAIAIALTLSATIRYRNM